MAFVTLTRPEHGIAVVTLNRPERMNALSVVLAEQLLATQEQVAADDSVGAVVLTGAGRGFCAGGDVKEMELNRDKSTDQRRADLAMMHRIPAVMAGMAPVVVAAVNGAAYGAGMGVALTADLVLASDQARFGTAFLKQGLVSDFGLSYQLTRLAGPGVARRVILLDQVLSAEAARTAGLVAEVHAPEALMEAAMGAARKLAAWPADARGEMKRLLRQAETASHGEMLEAEAAQQLALITSPDHAAAVDAFNTTGKI